MTVGPDGMPYGPEGGIVAQMNEAEERDHVDMLREKLLHRDPARRSKAAIAMACYVGDQMYLPEVLEPHPAPVLVKELQKPGISKSLLLEGTRAFAIMGSHCAEYASELLGLLVNYGDPEVRFEAMRAVRIVGPGASDGAAAALALAVVEHEFTSALLRFEAARALEALGPAAAPASAAQLAQALEDVDPDVRLASCRALVAMGEAAAEAAAAALVAVIKKDNGFEMKRTAFDALTAMGPGAAIAADELGRVTRPKYGDDPVLRKKAAEALLAIGVDEVRRPERQLQLAKALGDKDPAVVKAAREALHAAGCKRALEGSMALFDKIPEPAAAPAAPARAAEAAPQQEPPAEQPQPEPAGGATSSPEEPGPEVSPAEPPQAPPSPVGGEGGAEPEKEEEQKEEEAAQEAPEESAEPEPAAPPKPMSTFADFMSQAENRSKEKQDQVRAESEKVMANLGLSPDETA